MGCERGFCRREFWINFFGAAAVLDFIPAEIKVAIAITVWLSGVVGFSFKEVFGGKLLEAST
jgi:hypothetical protein